MLTCLLTYYQKEFMFTSSLEYNCSPGGTTMPYIDTLYEKGTGRLNEDAQLVARDLYGVFDGATSLGGATYDGLTGGYLASSLAAEVFSTNDGSLNELALKANEAIAKRMAACNVDLSRKEELWSTSAAVIRFSGNSMEWCQAGDCRIQLILSDGTSRQLVEPPDHDAETLRLWQQMAPQSDEPIHVVLADKILEVRRRMNVDYGVLNGEAAAGDFVRSGIESLSEVAAVLLYTDGLYVPDSTTGELHAPDHLCRLFVHGGLRAVRNYIRILQEKDPHCLLYPRFKPSDDISAIAVYQ
jgi:hypothetical protein